MLHLTQEQAARIARDLDALEDSRGPGEYLEAVVEWHGRLDVLHVTYQADGRPVAPVFRLDFDGEVSWPVEAVTS